METNTWGFKKDGAENFKAFKSVVWLGNPWPQKLSEQGLKCFGGGFENKKGKDKARKRQKIEWSRKIAL